MCETLAIGHSFFLTFKSLNNLFVWISSVMFVLCMDTKAPPHEGWITFFLLPHEC